MVYIKPSAMLTVQFGAVHDRFGTILVMNGDVNDGQRAGTVSAVDPMSIELATGLSIADLEKLGADPSPDVRAEIAVKFAHEFDRLASEGVGKLIHDLLRMFTRDRERLVRKRFAHAIRESPYLPAPIAESLARDEIDIASSILRKSPTLDDGIIGDIVKTMPETYALVIADRRPLHEPVVDLLIEHKGTKRIVSRLLDNAEAELSEDVLWRLRQWGQSDPDIANRLRRRPNLPFAFINQNVVELTDRVHWSSLGERTMTRFEATQLQRRFEGKAGNRCSSKSDRFHRLHRALKDEFEKGMLNPSVLLAFLRNRDVDRLECGFSIVTGLDLRRVRNLLYGSDRRGLIALCLRADFSTADYLAFRMVLSLAELGTVREQPTQHYREKTMRFAGEQFEKMRGDRRELERWLPHDLA